MEGLNQEYMPSFNHYIQITQAHIRQVRQQYGLPDDEAVVAMNSPFELRPERFDGKRGILLIHGFLTCPYMMKPIGELYYQQGFLVRSILLPGHGTTPDELNQAGLASWQQAIEDAIADLKTEVKEIHLCGYSLGAALACVAACHHPIKTLTLLSPAFGISTFSFLLPVANLLSQYRLAMRYLYVGGKKTYEDLATYSLFSPYAALQVYRAVQQFKAVFKPSSPGHARLTQIPCFIVHSADDSTVKLAPILNYFKNNQCSESRLRLYARQVQPYADQRITVLPGADPAARIFDFSHISVLIPPADPYYGKDGRCYGAVSTTSYFGEYCRRNARHKPFYRLSYNPDFANMAKQFTDFLNSGSVKDQCQSY